MARKLSSKKKKRYRLRRKHTIYLQRLNGKKLHREALKRVLKALQLPDLFKDAPEILPALLMEFGVRSIRLLLADGVKVPHRKLNAMRLWTSYMMRTTMIPVFPGLEPVSLEDFFTVGHSLCNLAEMENEITEKRLQKIAHQLVPFRDYNNDIRAEPLNKLFETANAIAFNFCRINQMLYWFSPLPLVIDDKLSVSIVLHTEKPQVKQVKINGKFRPVYRVGHPVSGSGIQWMKISAGDLGISCSFSDLKMDIYIQSHALIRLRERINRIDHSVLQSFLIISIYRKEVVRISDKTVLLAYRLYNLKTGYLVIEIVEGIALIKTFLFITNTGTPEGDRLDRELYIGKIEKQFLHIDKLSTFLETDIMKDQRVRTVFEKAGLESLCTFHPKSFDKRTLKMGYAADFVKYMRLD